MLIYGRYECFVKQMLYVCVLCASYTMQGLRLAVANLAVASGNFGGLLEGILIVPLNTILVLQLQ